MTSSPPTRPAGNRALVVALVACLLVLLLAAPLGAQSAEAQSAQTPAGVSLEEQRRDTIRYGIDSEIADLLAKLTTEKEARYNEDLLGLLKSSRSVKLRIGVLDLLAYLEWKGAEAPAMAIVEERDNQDADLVASCLSYLASVRSKDALKYVGAIIKEDNKKLLPALVRLMGKAGGGEEEAILLDWFDGDTATPAIKEEAIKALGEIGSAKAAERLGKLVEDAEGGKVPRMFACAALAKIKDEASVKPLVKASNDADPNVRAAAIEALGAFADRTSDAAGEARAALVQGLRDSFPKARIAACKAIAVGKVADALPFLKYKARNDPERSVKIESFRTLAILGSGDAYAFLREGLEDKKASAEMRSLCFGLLARYDPASSMDALASVLRAEAAEKERSFYTDLAREVANADKAPDIGKLARILLADKEYLIRIAGIEWARKNKSSELKPDLESLAANDPSEAIRKRAAVALKSY